MFVYVIFFDYFKDFFSYIIVCKKVFDVSSIIYMQYYVVGSYWIFGYYYFIVVLLGIFVYWIGGVFKGRIFGNFIFCRNF